MSEALSNADGKKGVAAARLGISRSTLWRKLKSGNATKA
ncbi:MAG: hypothetical protein LBB60_04445 [Desulfovibrio sp.]|nr:hypothetical protein [Desulfovibrio sp.]